jgi:hypothetical protein
MNDSAGIVYIINQAGSGWIQLDNDGNIDIYGSGSISVRTEKDFNVHADGDFNLESEAINMKARGSDGIKIEAATGDIDIRSNLDTKITADRNMHLRAFGYIRATAPLIDLNGPTAETATKPTINSLTVNRGVKESVSPRVPEHEPWGGHNEGETRIPAQARASLQTRTRDYDLAANSGGGGSNSPATNAPAVSQPAPGLNSAGASTRRFDARESGAADAPAGNSNPRTGSRFDDPNASGAR